MRPLDVIGVRAEMSSKQPIVLLRESGGGRFLPIWIGAAEATAIMMAQQGQQPPRPMTHDLMVDVMAVLDARLVQVQITDLVEGVFYALLVFDSGAQVSARPSDAIALALRTGASIIGAEEVLDAAGVLLPEEDDDEVEKFREFLDQVTPEDFASGGEAQSES